MDEPSVTIPRWVLVRLLGHGKTARFGSNSRSAWEHAVEIAKAALSGANPPADWDGIARDLETEPNPGDSL